MTGDSLETVGVVTCFLRNDARVLLLRRSDAVGSYSGLWGAVAGHAEGDPAAAAREEICEETGLDPRDEVTPVRAGDPFPVDDRDRGTRWLVHPFLFEAATREIAVNYETTEYEWVPPTEMLRRETVPDLWRSYDRVRPGVETVANDRDHGSAYLSVRALEVLRDEAAVADAEGVDDARHGGEDTHGRGDGTGSRADLASVARELREARPSMPVVRHRIDRAMATASGSTPAAIERAATEGIERALTADREAAAVAADRVGSRIATLSRSGTVLDAVEAAAPDSVLVAESRPGREGVDTARAVAERTDATVTLTTDAALGGELAAGVDALLVGADAVLADGRVVNKVGTRSAATVAAREGIDCYAVAASDKITHREGFDPEPRDPGEVYDGDGDGGDDLSVANPTFEATPAALFDAVLTERGPLDADEVSEVAATHREHAAWVDDSDE